MHRKVLLGMASMPYTKPGYISLPADTVPVFIELLFPVILTGAGLAEEETQQEQQQHCRHFSQINAVKQEKENAVSFYGCSPQCWRAAV